MLKNYLNIAWRTMYRQRLYSLINIIGLTIGIVSTLLITAFVRYELSYESFLEDISQVYRVVQRQPGFIIRRSDTYATMPAPLAKTLEAEMPEIEAATAFRNEEALLSVGDSHRYESGLTADDRFFQVFRYPVTQGDPAKMLTEPGLIALSKDLGERLFGSEKAMGQIINYAGRSFKVSGIFANVPKNSHLQFEYVASILDNKRYLSNRNRWGNSAWYTYFRLRDGQSIDVVESKIAALPKRIYGDDLSIFTDRREFLLQPATSVHLQSHINNEISDNGDVRFIYLLIAIGIVILLLACINYVNLAIATSMQRAKEVGVRKVVGAARGQIVVQFLSQSTLTVMIAVLLSLLILADVLPRFAHFTVRDLSFFANGFWSTAIIVGIIIITVSIAGGLYPSFVVGRMQPISVLKGTKGIVKQSGGIRRTLVTLQFAASMTLIASTLVIFRQMQYIQSKDIGYDRDYIVNVRVQDDKLKDQYSEIKHILLQHPNVVSVSSSQSDLTNVRFNMNLDGWTGHKGEDQLLIYLNSIEYDLLDLYEIPIVRGRGFSRDYPFDESQHALIINETAFKALGWQDLDGKYVAQGAKKWPVVGVVRDFHIHPLRQKIIPFMMFIGPNRSDFLSIKIASTDISKSIQFIEQALQSRSAYPIQVRFVDDVLAQLYASDQKFGEIVGLFTVVALLIGVLGLFGLVAYSAQMRTKEIGVRKVLGASVPSILRLFAQDYIGLIAIAGLIGTPIAYFAMREWLSQFAYRIALGPLDFLTSIAVLMIVAACSIAYQAVSAATQNPVHSLHHE